MTYYVKGGSKYDDSDAKAWMGVFLSGYNSDEYADPDWTEIDYDSHIQDDDPYWRLGGTGGEAKAEFGLWNGARLRAYSDAIQIWDTTDDEWETIIEGGSISANIFESITTSSGSATADSAVDSVEFTSDGSIDISATDDPEEVNFVLDPTLSGIDWIDFDTTASPSWQEGRLHWNNTDKTLTIDTDVNGVKLQIGQEGYIRAKNDTGATLENGDVVYVDGGSSGDPTIALAQANDHSSSHRVIGMVTHDIADGDVGYATIYGKVRDLDTSAYSVGDGLWLSPTTAGGWTATEPNEQNERIRIGYVITSDASDGSILFVRNPMYNAADIKLNHLAGADVDDVQGWMNSQSAGYRSGGNFTDQGAGTVRVSEGVGAVKSTDSETGELYYISWSQTDLDLTGDLDTTHWIYVDWNSGSPSVEETVTFENITGNDQFILGRVYIDASNNLTFFEGGTEINNFMWKDCKRIYEIYGAQRASGLIISETGTRNVAVSSGVFYCGHTRKTTSAIDTSGADTFTYIYRDGAGGWTRSTGETQINNTNYDDGDGTLGTVTNNRYGVHWLYIDYGGNLYVQYGQGNYNKLSDAQAATIPATSDYLADFSLFLGRIIIEKNASSFDAVESVFTAQFGTAPITDHGDLAGLGDDDHTQYLLSGGDTMSGNLDMDGNNVDLNSGSLIANSGGGDVTLSAGELEYLDGLDQSLTTTSDVTFNKVVQEDASDYGITLTNSDIFMGVDLPTFEINSSIGAFVFDTGTSSSGFYFIDHNDPNNAYIAVGWQDASPAYGTIATADGTKLRLMPTGSTSDNIELSVDGSDKVNMEWRGGNTPILTSASSDFDFDGNDLLNIGSLGADINDLDNVNASPSDEQVLTWNDTASEWQAEDGGGGALGDLSNVDSALEDILISLDDEGSSFPATPSDGQLFWDTGSESMYRYEADASSWIEIGGGASSTVKAIVAGLYKTSTQDLSDDEEVTWDSVMIETREGVIDADASDNSITIKESGVYEIYAEIGSSTDNTSRGELGCELRKDDVAVDGTRFECYARTSAQGRTHGAVRWIVDKTDETDETWTVHCYNSENDTDAEGDRCRFIIHKMEIGATGISDLSDHESLEYIPGLYRDSMGWNTVDDEADPPDVTGLGSWTQVELSSYIYIKTLPRWDNSAIGRHMKFLVLDDNDSSDRCEIRFDFDDDQATGTMEFWFMVYDNRDDIYLNIYDGSSSHRIYFRFDNDGDLYYYDGSTHSICGYNDYKWNHIRIEWDCSDQWTVWVNAEEYGPYDFDGSPSAMDQFIFQTYNSGYGHILIDAIGLSWDDNYDVGDNWKLEPQAGDWTP